MLESDVSRGVQICVEFKVTFTAMEQRLRFTIRTMLEATFTTSLRGMARVDSNHANALRFCFVSQHLAQAGEAPLVHLPFQSRAFAGFHPLPNLGQILNYYHTAGRDTLNDATTHHMVTIRAKTGQATFEAFQSLAGAFCSFALQTALVLKVAAFDVLPTLLSKKLVVAGNGGSRDSEIGY